MYSWSSTFCHVLLPTMGTCADWNGGEDVFGLELFFMKQDLYSTGYWSMYWNYPFPTEPSYIVLQIVNPHFNFY